MNTLDPYVRNAIDELLRVDLHAIQIETARVWCGRAIAAALLGMQQDAREYAHEALEHAALAGDAPLMREIDQELRAQNLRF